MFFFAVSEINTYLALKHFVWKGQKGMTLLEFRRKLAFALIHNNYLGSERDMGKNRESRKAIVSHYIKPAPPHARGYFGGKWDLTAKFKYQQYLYRGLGCRKKVRTYCACILGHWMCIDYHSLHLVQEVTSPSK